MKVTIDGIEYLPVLPVVVGTKPLRVVLREARKALGLTLSEASSMIGIAQTSLRNLEIAQHAPYFHTAVKIAQVYGIPIHILAAAALNEE